MRSAFSVLFSFPRQHFPQTSPFPTSRFNVPGMNHPQIMPEGMLYSKKDEKFIPLTVRYGGRAWLGAAIEVHGNVGIHELPGRVRNLPQALYFLSLPTRVTRRISQRLQSRIRGPHVPVPRQTMTGIPPTSYLPASSGYTRRTI